MDERQAKYQQMLKRLLFVIVAFRCHSRQVGGGQAPQAIWQQPGCDAPPRRWVTDTGLCVIR